MPYPDPRDHSLNPQATPSKRQFGNRGKISRRPNASSGGAFRDQEDASFEERMQRRDAIIRSYNEQDASRARNARLDIRSRQPVGRNSDYYNSDFASREMRASQNRQEMQNRQNLRAQRFSDMSSNRHFDAKNLDSALSFESSERRDYHERQRAARDRRSQSPGMQGNRKLIDARGSVDSRAFNELDELVNYSINETDKPDPLVDVSNPKAKWKSHSGNEVPQMPRNPLASSLQRGSRRNLASLSDTISGKDSYGSPMNGGILNSYFNLPPFIKIAIPVVLVLAVVLVVILFF